MHRPRPVRVEAERYTMRDMGAVIVIMVLVVALATVAWVTSDRSQATLRHGGKAEMGTAIVREPTGLKVVWRAPSPLTSSRLVHGPLVAGPVVLTGTHDTVTGRSPLTGTMVWEYRRGKLLCGLEAAWGSAITAWRFPGGCGDIMLIRGAGGRYGASRSGFAAEPRRIVTGGHHVLSIGSHQVEAWRSDMVRTVLVGRSETPLEPSQAEQQVCKVVDAVENTEAVGVLRQCPGDASLRFSVFNAVPEEDVEPEEKSTWLTGAQHGAVIEVRNGLALLYLAEPRPRFAVTSYPLEEGNVTLSEVRIFEETPARWGRATVPGIPVVRTDKSLFWHDGKNLYAFDAESFALKWSTPQVVGTPAVISTLMGSLHWLLAPVKGGLALLDGTTGKQARLLPIPGSDISKVTVVGGMIVAQQGDSVLGLAPQWDGR